MTPLETLRTKLADATAALEALDREHRRRRLDGARMPMGAVRKISRARAEVRELEAQVRAARVDQAELIPGARLTT